MLRAACYVAFVLASWSAAAQAQPADDARGQLESLSREIQLLRAQVERLEARVQELERGQNLSPADTAPMRAFNFTPGAGLMEAIGLPRQRDDDDGPVTLHWRVEPDPPFDPETGWGVVPNIEANGFPPTFDADESPFVIRGHIKVGPRIEQDKGLYVFPGLDAPPLSPANVPSPR